MVEVELIRWLFEGVELIIAEVEPIRVLLEGVGLIITKVDDNWLNVSVATNNNH